MVGFADKLTLWMEFALLVPRSQVLRLQLPSVHVIARRGEKQRILQRVHATFTPQLRNRATLTQEDVRSRLSPPCNVD